MRALELFAGIGGFSCGFERSGIEVAALAEIDPKARRVLAKHWPQTTMHKDVRKLSCAQGEYDLISGGFPCQDISRAGKMEGINGGKSGLWFEMRRLIRDAKPRIVVVENVKRLLSDGLVTVLQNLHALGYDAEWHCIPCYAVGSPQERDRVFVVAYSRAFDYGRPGWVGRWISGTEEARQLGWQGTTSAYVQLETEPALDRVANGLSSDVDRCRLLGNAINPKISSVLGAAIASRAA